MRALFFTYLLSVFLGHTAIYASYEFPRPKSLEPNIQFWKRVYGEVTTHQIILSDHDDLSLVYDVIDLPFNKNARNKAVKNAKKELKSTLQRLDKLKPSSASRLKGQMHRVYKSLEKNNQKDKYKHWGNIRSQPGLKDRFAEGFKRCGAHEYEIRLRLKQANLPEELIGIAFVESLFHPKSRSGAGATGIWQFMRRTAHEFMCVNRLVDERLDPIVSTDAAIKYIKSAQESLDTWPLIITSYNYGRRGVEKMVQKVGSSDFNIILKKYKAKRFGFAARNYYAEFLAAVDTYRDAHKIFKQERRDPSWAYDILELPKPFLIKDLIETQSIQVAWLETYNPALTRRVLRGQQVLPKGFTLRVPLKNSPKIEKKLKKMPGRKAGRRYRFTKLPEPLIKI